MRPRRLAAIAIAATAFACLTWYLPTAVKPIVGVVLPPLGAVIGLRHRPRAMRVTAARHSTAVVMMVGLVVLLAAFALYFVLWIGLGIVIGLLHLWPAGWPAWPITAIELFCVLLFIDATIPAILGASPQTLETR